MISDYDRKVLDKKINNILEKYKDKRLTHQKLRRACEQLKGRNYIRPQHYRELAKLTAKLDYGCNFKDGNCKEQRSSEACCCTNCRGQFGFFHHRFFATYNSENDIEKELMYYVNKFSISTGFWRKGKGCILPRERRSQTCLTYHCKHSNFTRMEQLLLDVIRTKSEFPDYIRTIIYILKDYFLYREE